MSDLKTIVSASEFRRLIHTNPEKLCEMYFDLKRGYEEKAEEIESLKLEPEDRDKMHGQHVQMFEAERLRDRAEIERLRSQLVFLECLESCGVDNWSGYGDAQEMFNEATREGGGEL
jgi:hypothetical protein